MAELLHVLDQELAQLKSTERNAEEQYSFAHSRLRLIKTQIENLYERIEMTRGGQLSFPIDIRPQPED